MDYHIVKENLTKKTSEELLTIMEYSQDDYTPDAIMILKVILLDRGISMQDVEGADKRYKQLKAQIPVTGNQQRITKPVKSILWIISALSVSILLYFKNLIISPTLDYIVDKSKTEQPKKFEWTYENKNIIRGNLMKTSLIKGMQEKYKNPFCDCYIKHIEDRYPNGVTDSVPHLVKDTIVGDCAEYVKTNVR
ncbi:hypothetical protein [Mucilaginibacter sp. 3215]|uniref:hypothetical protein n=1 Tax=Mucilaginibacter sp. 3215 TaxID=3373912 RepID=UPI003D1B29A7